MYHEPTLTEMVRQSDGWAWAVCTVCDHRAPIWLTIPARQMPAGTGILAFAARLRCARGHRRCVIAKPISARGAPCWDSPEIAVEHPVDLRDSMRDSVRAAHDDLVGYAAWLPLSRMRWYAAPDIALAGAVRDVGFFLARAEAGAPFDWHFARRAIIQLTDKEHHLVTDAAKADAARLDGVLHALGETEAQRETARHSGDWTLEDQGRPMPSGKPWKRRDH